MSHLTIERLSALADEQPTALEAAHLGACPACRCERDAYRSLVAIAVAEREAGAAPLLAWETVRGALADEGLVGVASGARAQRIGSRPRPWLRAAAAVILAAGGVAVGRYSARAGAATAAGEPAGLATFAGARSGAEFGSREEAFAALTSAEQQYQRASMFLAAHDSTGSADSSGVYLTRLAALDGVMAASRQALREAPHDPVINRYYLATMGAREVTMQQLNTVLPVNRQVQRF